MRSSARTLLLAFALLLIGAALPFLMMLEWLPKTLPLGFVSYGASVGGLFVGILGAAMYVGEHRRDE